MSKLKYLCLILISVLFSSTAVLATMSDNPSLASLLDKHTLTHTPTLELKPIPRNTYKTAAAVFLPDVTDSDLGFGGRDLENNYNRGNCAKNDTLYTTANCSYPRTLPLASLCPFQPGSYTRCECLPEFKIASCPSPKLLSSPQCDGKAQRCVCPSSVSLPYPNDVCTQYCDGSCIAKTCTPTVGETGCSYGTNTVTNNCGGTRLVCKPCNLTPCTSISTKPANSSYTTTSCTDCSGAKTINNGWSCNSGYHKDGSSCIKDCTPAVNETGCSYGTYSCTDGCSGTRTCCSACSKPVCTSISSKPANSSYTTTSCTDCSGAKTINSGWSCNSGYKKSGDSCILDTMSCNDLSTLISNTAENTQINMISNVECIDNPLTLKKGQKLYGNGYTLKISLIDNPYGITMNKDSSIENIKFEMKTVKGKVYSRNILYIPLDSGNNTLKDITFNLNDVQSNGGHYFAYFRAGTLNLVGNLTFNAACNSAGNYGSIFTSSFQGGPEDRSEVTVLMRDVRINANICQLDLFSGGNMVTEVLGNSQITATILRNGSISPVIGFDVTRLNFTDNSIITLYTSDVGLSLSDAKQSYISNYAKVNIKAKNESGLGLFDGWGAKLTVQGNAVLDLCSAKTTFDTSKITKSGAGKATSRVDASCGNGL